MLLPKFLRNGSSKEAPVSEPPTLPTYPVPEPKKPPQKPKSKKKSRWILGLLAAGALLIGSTTIFLTSRKPPKVDIEKLTVPVKSQNLSLRITASGSVVPIQSVNLSPKTSGRLKELRVEQSDRVVEGQIIGIMENRELQAQLLQAQANVRQAQARLSEAQAGSRIEEIDQAQARLVQAQARLAQTRRGRPEQIAQAQARLNQAQARLSQARRGRPEEIAQAQAQLEDAQGKVSRTRQRVKSFQSLADQGAITRDQLNEVKTENISAESNLRQAQQRLAQVRRGGRVEEIEQLQAAVSEARSALEQSQQGRPEEIQQLEGAVAESRYALAQLQNGTRPEQIQQLRAAVEAAQAQVATIRVQLEDTQVRAPFSGIVTQKYASVGAFVTPTTSASSTNSATSTSIVAIAKDLEVKAKVPEVDISRIKLGQEVQIVPDAYPDKVFKGTVRLVAPEAVVEQNVTSFEVRIKILTGKEDLRSGMNLNVTFLGDKLANALVVPTVAIVTQKGETGVMVVGAQDRPQFRPIKVGSSIEDKTQILEGIKEGDRVFIDIPKDLKPIENNNRNSNADQNRAVRTGARALRIRTRP